MAERKCDYQPLVDASGGRVPCPPNLFKAYYTKGKCVNCPKARRLGERLVNEPANLGDQIARQIVREQMYRR